MTIFCAFFVGISLCQQSQKVIIDCLNRVDIYANQNRTNQNGSSYTAIYQRSNFRQNV